MFLFNLIFAHSFFKSPSYLIKYNDTDIELENRILNKNKSPISLLPILVSRSNVLNISQENLADKEFLSGNFLTNFVNNFWQQTIFLSVPTQRSEKYISELTALNLTRPKMSQKKFLSQFSKSLINGSIQSSFSDNLLSKQSSSSIKYIWKKSWLNFNYALSSKNIKSLQLIPKKIQHKLKMNHFPLFVVTNHLNQIIIAEPPEESIVNSELNKQYAKPCYQAWFFTNYEDAQEYLEHVKKQYQISDSGNQLRIFICNLETFYRLSSKSRNTLQFRLVPDLYELGQLVTRYSSYSNIEFNKNQSYGKDYFQGQPVYLFKNHNCYYEITEGNKQIRYKPVFTNYKTAIFTYANMLRNTQSQRLLKNPDIIVYNLEQFLEQQVCNSDSNDMPFLLIPSKSSYEFTKKSQTQQSRGFIFNDFSFYLSYLNLWTKRVIWSLTSRQPQDW